MSLTLVISVTYGADRYSLHFLCQQKYLSPIPFVNLYHGFKKYFYHRHCNQFISFAISTANKCTPTIIDVVYHYFFLNIEGPVKYDASYSRVKENLAKQHISGWKLPHVSTS